MRITGWIAGVVFSVCAFCGCAHDKSYSERVEEISNSADRAELIDIAINAQPYGVASRSGSAPSMWEGLAAVKRLKVMKDSESLKTIASSAKSTAIKDAATK